MEQHRGRACWAEVGGVTSMAVKGPEERSGRQEDTQERTQSGERGQTSLGAVVHCRAKSDRD